MELNKEQIKRVFECCISSKNVTDCISNECPLWSPCDDEVCADDVAFARMGLQIYKELTEEIEDLKAIAEGYQKQFEDCAEDRARLTEENERLRTAIPLWAKQCVELEERCMQLRSDTVRKMQERLDKHFCHDPAFLGVEQRLIIGVIDQIAEEIISDGS